MAQTPAACHRVLVVSGEASGDLHGSHLMRSLKALRPDLELCSIGGPLMKEASDSYHRDIVQTAVTGFGGLLAKIPFFLKLLKSIQTEITSLKPDLVVFVDNPGLNLRIAKRIHKLRIPLVYYIAPQLWAWNPGRIHLMKKLFAKVLVIFDFEKEIFDRHNVPAVWVGHPLKDEVPMPQPRLPLDPERMHIAVMPGSRLAEIRYCLPAMLDACNRIGEKFPQARFSLIQAATISSQTLNPYLTGCRVPVTVTQDKRQTLLSADFGIICSGTATLEAALYGLPMVIVYKTTFLTAWLGRRLIRVPFLGLPNLLAGEAILPERIQETATGPHIASAALGILENRDRLSSLRTRLADLRKKLGNTNSSEYAAREVLKTLRP